MECSIRHLYLQSILAFSPSWRLSRCRVAKCEMAWNTAVRLPSGALRLSVLQHGRRLGMGGLAWEA